MEEEEEGRGEEEGHPGGAWLDVRSDSTRLTALAPTWRSTGDVSIPSDVLEEVARITGTRKSRPQPRWHLHSRPSGRDLPLDRRVREQLAAASVCRKS